MLKKYYIGLGEYRTLVLYSKRLTTEKQKKGVQTNIVRSREEYIIKNNYITEKVCFLLYSIYNYYSRPIQRARRTKSFPFGFMGECWIPEYWNLNLHMFGWWSQAIFWASFRNKSVLAMFYIWISNVFVLQLQMWFKWQ